MLMAWVLLGAATAPPGSLSLACQARLAADTTRADAVLVPLFVDLKQRIPLYATWLFEWNPSYQRDRQLLGVAVDEGWQRLKGGELAETLPAIRRRLEDQIEQSFIALVVLPEVTDPALARSWSELQRPGLRPGPLPTSGELAREIDGPVRAALIRTPRPVVARFLGMSLRSVVGLSTVRVARTVADVTDLGVVALLPGLALGLANATVWALGLDFAISSADSYANRHEFESDLGHSLDSGRVALAQSWARRLQDLDPESPCALP